MTTIQDINIVHCYGGLLWCIFNGEFSISEKTRTAFQGIVDKLAPKYKMNTKNLTWRIICFMRIFPYNKNEYVFHVHDEQKVGFHVNLTESPQTCAYFSNPDNVRKLKPLMMLKHIDPKTNYKNCNHDISPKHFLEYCKKLNLPKELKITKVISFSNGTMFAGFNKHIPLVYLQIPDFTSSVEFNSFEF